MVLLVLVQVVVDLNSATVIAVINVAAIDIVVVDTTTTDIATLKLMLDTQD